MKQVNCQLSIISSNWKKARILMKDKAISKTSIRIIEAMSCLVRSINPEIAHQIVIRSICYRYALDTGLIPKEEIDDV